MYDPLLCATCIFKNPYGAFQQKLHERKLAIDISNNPENKELIIEHLVKIFRCATPSPRIFLSYLPVIFFPVIRTEWDNR